MFGGTYAPRDWALCNGQLLPIPDYQALFSLIETTYGGDGVQTFGVPDLSGRIPVGTGQGTGMRQNYRLGEKGGVEEVTLSQQQLPAHRHKFQASKGPGTSPDPANQVIGSPPAVSLFKGREAPSMNMPAQMVSPMGGSHPHENRVPFLTVTYIISLEGIFPSQP